MRITFVGHASILIHTGSIHLLMDPWLQGEAFNGSWSLHPDPVLSDEDLASVTHIWISHEHPDHLSPATLRAIPDHGRAEITALFQNDYKDETVKYISSLGFKELIELPRATFMALAPGVDVYNRQVGYLDSSLAVRAEGRLVLNINDCELPDSTMRAMRRELGPIDVLLDQFSIAGWSGNADEIRRKERARRQVLRKFLRDVEVLDPRFVIPFASFVRFSHRENAHMNSHINTVDDVAERVDPERLVVMYPGDTWDVEGRFRGTQRAMERYREDFGRIPELPTRTHDVVPLEKVLAATDRRLRDMRLRYHDVLLRWIPPVTFYVEDLGRALEVDVRRGAKEVALSRADCMVILSSQAMWYAFAYRWGLPTLGVSGRMVVNQPDLPFRRLKKLGAVYSSGSFSRERKSFLNRRLLGYLWGRRGDLYSQFVRRLI